MANTANKAIHPVDLPPASTVTAEDLVMVIRDPSANANLQVAELETIYKNYAVPTAQSNNIGGIWFDSNYLYIRVSNTVVKRVSLESF